LSCVKNGVFTQGLCSELERFVDLDLPESFHGDREDQDLYLEFAEISQLLNSVPFGLRFSMEENLEYFGNPEKYSFSKGSLVMGGINIGHVHYIERLAGKLRAVATLVEYESV